jgi:hypothetical protein
MDWLSQSVTNLDERNALTDLIIRLPAGSLIKSYNTSNQRHRLTAKRVT